MVFRNSRSLAIAALIALSATFAVSCKSGAGDAEGEVVAKVGSREITMRQVDSVIKQQLEANGGGSLSPSELIAARLSSLDNLIKEETLFQRAQKENLVPDDTKVKQEIQKFKQERGMSEEQYQTFIKQVGMTEDELRDKARRELAISELNDRQKARVSAPTDADIEKYFNDNKSEWVAERGADISIIITDPANNGAADDAIGEIAAENKIKAIYEQLKGGADFSTIARQRSEDASAVREGRVGFGSEAALRQTFPTRPEIPARLMTMSPGQFTEPIKDNITGRWIIIKVNTVRQQPQKLTLNDVRKNIIDTITQQRQQILLNALVMVATSESSIKNYLAERIVTNPQAIIEMKPSQLLDQSVKEQAQPRIENENHNAAEGSSNSNSNRSSANANR
jgi:parvulin-like peptidyl-prolyl isomerase